LISQMTYCSKYFLRTN